MPEFLEVLLEDRPALKAAYWVILGAIGLLILFGLYRKFAPGPRRRRQLREVRAALSHGSWQEALNGLDKVRRIGRPSAGWQRRFDDAEAQALELAQAAALLDRQFDAALDYSDRIARLRNQDAMEARIKIQGAMLTEMRRLFSIPGESRSVLELGQRILQVHSPCREVNFWQGMAYLRAGQPEKALESFLLARGGDDRKVSLDEELVPRPQTPPSQPGTPFLDPSLYLGAMLLRQGRGKDSLRFLTEANRMDSNCPVVTILLGSAIVEAGGDTKFAVKALQRALGAKGLQIWADQPQRAWVEGFPEGRSYIRRLASNHPFHCPLFGSDLKYLQLQGMLSQAQGLYKLGEYQEAANIFTRLIQEGAPSLAVVRGIGLSLARIGKYDEAFKHLRAAHEMENPPQRDTAGFLALCGAKGTPKSEEDRLRNVAWAIQNVTQFTAPKDEEWTSLVSAIFDEARDAGLPLSEDDQLYLCEHLFSVHATDPLAAKAYHHLFVTFPHVVRPEYAFLFIRAAQMHRIDEPRTLDLFALAFSDRPALQMFFEEQGWSVPDVEYAYLVRTAEMQPGQFPAALGPDYPPQGEELLRARSLELEKAGELDASLAVADILGKLAPGSAMAQDRVASLYYRRGQIDQALEVLTRWKESHPSDPLPLARAALILQTQGQTDNALQLLEEARHKATGPLRGTLSYLSAQLTLRQVDEQSSSDLLAPERLQKVRSHLEACLEDRPDHPRALWQLAALRWLMGDEHGVAALADRLDGVEQTEAPVLYFAALSRHLQGDHARAVTLCSQLQRDFLPVAHPIAAGEITERNGSAGSGDHIEWAIEAAYLKGLAKQAQGNPADAAKNLELTARAGESPSAHHAQAMLGQVSFLQGSYEQASRWWQHLDQRHRATWKIGEALGGTVFLTALESMEQGRFEEAAERFRSAGKQGCRDRRLGQLLLLALFRGGQKAFYGQSTS